MAHCSPGVLAGALVAGVARSVALGRGVDCAGGGGKSVSTASRAGLKFVQRRSASATQPERASSPTPSMIFNQSPSGVRPVGCNRSVLPPEASRGGTAAEYSSPGPVRTTVRDALNSHEGSTTRRLCVTLAITPSSPCATSVTSHSASVPPGVTVITSDPADDSGAGKSGAL